MSTEETLRSRLETLRAEGRPLDLASALGIIVPLSAELADQHKAGYTFYVYPSALSLGADGHYHANEASAQVPQLPQDLACLPPEAQGVHPGQGRASVFGVSAMLYELITLQSVGSGMRRPSELVPGLPPQLEMILAKALVADPSHRPDDLNALAQALHQINVSASLAPPPADVSLLDHDGGFDVDVSLSLLPPPPTGTVRVEVGAVQLDAPLPPGVTLPGPRGQARPAGGAEDLLAIKSRLEADRMPRYVVIREGMDHGPFSAVELLQQIASHSFGEFDVLRDAVTSSEVTIGMHPDFSQFAKHARLHREQTAEKVAIEQAVVKESQSAKSKAVIIGSVTAAVVVIAGGLFLRSRGSQSDEIRVMEDQATNVESSQSLGVQKKAQSKSGGGPAGGGGVQVAGGQTCEAAQANYVEELKVGGGGQADLTRGQFQAVLGTGSYLNGCGLSSSTAVNICAAIQNGRAVGVTVSTTPSDPGVANCIASHVRGLSFPAHPKLDVTRTTFAAQ